MTKLNQLMSLKVKDDHTIFFAIIVCLAAIVALYFYLQVFLPPVTTVDKASKLTDGSKVVLNAQVSKITKDQYGNQAGTICDYTGCLKAKFQADSYPQLYSLDRPVKIIGIMDSAGFERRLNVQEMRIE